MQAAIAKLHSLTPSSAKAPRHIKQGALPACAANADAAIFDGLIHNQRSLLFYESWEDKGMVITPGVFKKRDVRHTDSLKKAEELGRSF